MNKSKKTIIILCLFFVFFIPTTIFIKINDWKFYTYYFRFKLNLLDKFIENKNKKTIETLKNGKIIFEDKEYNYLKFPLKKYGVKYLENHTHRPLGYFDIYNNRIIFASYDGTLFYSNEINEIKKGTFFLTKFKVANYNFNFNPDDELFNHRNIKIRDILVDNDNLFIVSHGRKKLNKDTYYSEPEILKGKIDIDNSSIYLNKFLNFEEKIFDTTDWSHSGGRLIKYKNSSFLLSVSDYALMDDLKKFEKKLNSKETIFGKIFLIKDNKFEIFSMGHRNPQGLYYDKENDLIFETEHGPTGGDEINLIKKGNHYGWPKATYGAFIVGLNIYRKHNKHGYTDPLTHWWPASSAVSEIVKINPNFNKKWKKYTLINATLSGSQDQGLSLYRWEFDIKKEKLIKKGKYHIGDRIRDLKYLDKQKTIMMLLEDQKSLVLIYE